MSTEKMLTFKNQINFSWHPPSKGKVLDKNIKASRELNK